MLFDNFVCHSVSTIFFPHFCPRVTQLNSFRSSCSKVGLPGTMIFSLAIAAAACIENDAASASDETTMFPMNLPHRPAGSLSPGHKGAPNGRSNNSAPPPSFLPESFSLYFFASGRGTSVSPPLRSFFFGPRLPSPLLFLYSVHNSNSSNNAGDAPLYSSLGIWMKRTGGTREGGNGCCVRPMERLSTTATPL